MYMKGQSTAINQMKLANRDVFIWWIIGNGYKIGSRQRMLQRSSSYTDSIDAFWHVMLQVRVVINCYSETPLSWMSFRICSKQFSCTMIRGFSVIWDMMRPTAGANQQRNMKYCHMMHFMCRNYRKTSNHGNRYSPSEACSQLITRSSSKVPKLSWLINAAVNPLIPELPTEMLNAIIFYCVQTKPFKISSPQPTSPILRQCLRDLAQRAWESLADPALTWGWYINKIRTIEVNINLNIYNISFYFLVVFRASHAKLYRNKRNIACMHGSGSDPRSAVVCELRSWLMWIGLWCG